MLLEEGVLVVYVHPHRGLAGNDGGSRDLWPGREVTQRLIYFTGVPLSPPPSSSPLSPSLFLVLLLASTISTTAHHRGALFVAREGPAADIVPHTRPVSRLYTRLHRIYMRKESILSHPPPPFPPRFIPGSNVSSRDPVTIPHKAPLDAPSSVNTVHHYRRGAYISKGTALASLRLSPVTLDTIPLLLFCRIP